MTSVKGIGKQTAYTLLGLMPELGTLTRRQDASLAGCALFMAAMAARNFHPELKLFYRRLIQNRKKPMVALTAVMHKLIVILNAKIRDEMYA